MLCTLGALASQKKDYTIWDNGNVKSLDFFGSWYNPEDEDYVESPAINLYGTQFQTSTYLKLYATTNDPYCRDAYITSSNKFNLARYSKVYVKLNIVELPEGSLRLLSTNETPVVGGLLRTGGIVGSLSHEISSSGIVEIQFDISSWNDDLYIGLQAGFGTIDWRILEWRLLR